MRPWQWKLTAIYVAAFSSPFFALPAHALTTLVDPTPGIYQYPVDFVVADGTPAELGPGFMGGFLYDNSAGAFGWCNNLGHECDGTESVPSLGWPYCEVYTDNGWDGTFTCELGGDVTGTFDSFAVVFCENVESCDPIGVNLNGDNQDIGGIVEITNPTIPQQAASALGSSGASLLSAFFTLLIPIVLIVVSILLFLWFFSFARGFGRGLRRWF